MSKASQVPPGWTIANISDTAQYINGFAFKPSHWGEVGRPIIRIQNLTDEDKVFNRTTLPVSDELVVRPGEIVVSWSATLDAFIWRREEAVLNQHIFRVVPESRLVHPRFLFHLLRWSIWRMKETEHLHGSTMKHINRGPFLGHQVVLPPLVEQGRMVAEVEKHFTRLDAAVASLRQVQANLKRYRAAVLKAACEGRLVPTEAELASKEGRSYETGEQLLARLLKERRAKWEADQFAKMHASGAPPKSDDWKKKYKDPQKLDISNLSVLPDGWTWASVDQLAWHVRNGISTKPEDSAGLAILRISAVKPMKVDVQDIRFLPDTAEYRDYQLEGGDLLFTRYNGTREFVGVCASVPEGIGALVHPDKLIRVRTSLGRKAGVYMAIATSVGDSRAFIESKIRTTAGQSGISGQDVRNIPIPLCPVAEQERIVAEVEERLSALEAAACSVTQDATRADRLRQSILKRAFEGKLVPQDPNDEPASALLERIRAERAAKKPKTRIVARRKAKTIAIA